MYKSRITFNFSLSQEFALSWLDYMCKSLTTWQGKGQFHAVDLTDLSVKFHRGKRISCPRDQSQACGSHFLVDRSHFTHLQIFDIQSHITLWK